MRLSTQFTVTVQMLLLIMVFKDRKITSELISESTGANPVMIRQLYGKLKNAGILQVSAGRGAIALNRPPEEISLWDIYMAVEGYAPDELFQFHPKISKGCQIGRFFKDVLGVHLDEAFQAMQQEMAAVTLRQLSNEWQDIQNAGGSA